MARRAAMHYRWLLTTVLCTSETNNYLMLENICDSKYNGLTRELPTDQGNMRV